MSQLEELRKRYYRLCHAMQTGVAFKMERNLEDVEPKHLRVGINSAMVEHAALVKVLISKGLLSEEEFWQALCEQMEEEVESYKQILIREYGVERIDLI